MRCMLCLLLALSSSSANKTWQQCLNDPNCVLVGSILARSNPSTAIFSQQVSPAIDLAVEKVNADVLYPFNVTMQVVHRLHGSSVGQCNGDGVGVAVSDMYHNQHVRAFIGPACSAALSHAARMAAQWNIPMVTGEGASREFVIKEPSFTTLTRFGYCQCQLRSVFAAILQLYNWHHVAVFIDEADSFATTIGDSLDRGLREANLLDDCRDCDQHKVFIIRYKSNRQHDYSEMLKLGSENARIFILSVSGTELRKFMLEAHALNMTSGEYAFLDIELFKVAPDVAWGDKSWKRGDDQDPAARSAYSALLRVALKHPKSADYDSFATQVKQHALNMFNYSWPINEDVNFFVGAFYDATVALGEALAEQLRKNESIDDGLATTSLMKNKQYNGTTGTFQVDGGSDRMTNYNLMDMDPSDGQFRVIGTYHRCSKMFKKRKNISIHWPNGMPPVDVPRCGFRNENQECWPKPESNTVSMLIIFGAVTAAILLISLLAHVIYRKTKYEQELKNMSWRVKWSDITFSTSVATPSYSIMSLASLGSSNTNSSDDRSSDVTNGNKLTFFAHYAGNAVTVTVYKNMPIDWKSRKFLEQMKMVSSLIHPDVAVFIGACVDPPHIAVLSEFCPRGTLSDLLHDSEIELDSVFKNSILSDIAKGLRYIHNSALPYHGQLNSENCLVDSRFVVKLSNWKMNGFEILQEKKTRLLYVAPEVLRDSKKLSKKSDIFSFGIIMAEVLEQAEPYDEERNFLDIDVILGKITNYNIDAEFVAPLRPKMFGQHSANIKHLYKTCLDEVPENRPTAGTILKDINADNKQKDINIVDSLLKRMEQYSRNLEVIVKERTETLESHQQQLESLLTQMLPQSVAKQLMAGKQVEPESFECVTVYLGCLVDFNTISCESTPLEIVTLLNDLYTCLDVVLSAYSAYKVDTIGDAYMVVSGLPERNGNEHARQMALWSLSVIKALKSFKIQHQPESKLRVRIGLNSGPVVAGVVGLKMPRYCIFGDTVNTASRMEKYSTGHICSSCAACKYNVTRTILAGRIHISASTFNLLSRIGGFELVAREPVPVKGKGLVQTYWLVEITGRTKSVIQTRRATFPRIAID